MANRRDSASDKLRRFGYDPLTYLVRTATDKQEYDAQKVDIAKELLPYAYPKLRSVEMTAHQLHEIVVSIGQVHASAMIEHDDVVPMTTTSPRKQSLTHVSGDDADDDA